jgi:predicted phosphoribosyltransferase
MYFADRNQAGAELAKKLGAYKGAEPVVIALSEGGVMVGLELVRRLGGHLTMLLSKNLLIPGETTAIGAVDQAGGFIYNDMLSTGQIEELVGEFHNFMEAEKFRLNSEIHHLVGQYGLLDRSQLKHKTIILVSDVASSGLSYDAAANYLKPVNYKRLIAATPIATVQAVDRLHIIADELCVLGVTDNFIDSDHYFSDHEVPKSSEVMALLTTDLTPLKQSIAEHPKRNYN